MHGKKRIDYISENVRHRKLRKMSGEIGSKEDAEMEADVDELWFITECVFCKKNLTTRNELNLSKLLQCLHASCHECCNAWKDNEDKMCPVCLMPSKKSEIRENKVLSEIVSDNEIPDMEGKVCNIHDAPVSHWCINCAEFICEDCVKSHGQLKSTRDHAIKTKDEHISSITMGEPKQVFPCSLHPQNQLTIVCHTCHAMTCRDCQLELHRDHKYDFVTDKMEDAKKEVYNFFKKIEYHSIVLTSALDKISVREKKLEDLKLKLIGQIKDVFDIIIDLIKKRCQELMLSAVSKTNEKLTECSIGRAELEKDLNSLKLCLTFVKTVLYKSSDPVIFYTKDLMLNHMERIRTKCRVPNAVDIINLRFSPDNLDNLKSGIFNFGCLNEMADTSEIDKTGYWKNVFATLMNTYSDQLGINTGIQQPHQQQMWQQILQFYNQTTGRQPIESQSQSQLQQIQEKLLNHLPQQQHQQQQQQQHQQLQQHPAQLQQIQQQINQKIHHQQQQQQQQQHQQQLQQQQQQQLQQQQQQQVAHHQQQQQIWHQRQQQQFRADQLSPQPNPHHQSKPAVPPLPNSVSPVSQNPLHNNQQVVLLAIGAGTRAGTPQQQPSVIQSRGNVSQQPMHLNSCQQSPRVPPVQQTLMQNHQQQLHQQRIANHQQSVIANGLHQRVAGQQSSISPQLQMAHARGISQPQQGHLLRTYSNLRNQQAGVQQHQQQLASPPAMQSPPLRGHISPSVSIHRTGLGARPPQHARIPDGRLQPERVPPLHQERVNQPLQERIPPSHPDQASTVQYHQQSLQQPRPPPPAYSFQIPLKHGSSSQVAIVEVKPIQVQHSSHLNKHPQEQRKLWHIPETVPMRSKSGEPPPTPHSDNIKKVKISQQPDQVVHNNYESPAQIKPSPSPTHYQPPQPPPDKLHQPEVQKRRPEVNLIPTAPICKEEQFTQDFADVLSTLNELNRSLDKVDIANDRPSADDREVGKQQSFDKYSHEDWCAACMDGGQLVCCDVCPKAFHHSCHIPVITNEEASGDWQCLLCKPVDPVVSADPTLSCLSASEKKAASRLLLEIYCQYDASLHLRQPVNPQNTRYYEIVRQPICLDQIRDKLASNRYSSMVEFVSDVKLMFNNYYQYNAADSPAMVQIKSLEDVFNSLLSRFLSDPVASLASIKTEAMET